MRRLESIPARQIEQRARAVLRDELGLHRLRQLEAEKSQIEFVETRPQLKNAVGALLHMHHEITAPAYRKEIRERQYPARCMMCW